MCPLKSPMSQVMSHTSVEGLVRHQNVGASFPQMFAPGGRYAPLPPCFAAYLRLTMLWSDLPT